MALGPFSKKRPSVVADAPPLPNAPEVEKPMRGNEGYGDQSPGYDPEATGPGGRKMSRIDGPITKSISQAGAGDLSDDSSGVSVGKQMELEAGNAIKYRTCSWPKV